MPSTVFPPPDATIDLIGVRPVSLYRDNGKAMVLDQVSCYRCARLVKLVRAMAGFANQYHLSP